MPERLFLILLLLVQTLAGPAYARAGGDGVSVCFGGQVVEASMPCFDPADPLGCCCAASPAQDHPSPEPLAWTGRGADALALPAMVRMTQGAVRFAPRLVPTGALSGVPLRVGDRLSMLCCWIT